MAIFNKRIWKNMVAQFPNRRRLTDPEDSDNYTLYNVSLDIGEIEQQGDEFEASEMNDLEDRIGNAFNSVEGVVSGYAESAAQSATASAQSATASSQSATSSSQSATASQNSSYDSEAWAIGKRNGISVTSTDEQYNNNSKYYASEAAISAGNASRSESNAHGFSDTASAASTISYEHAETSGEKALVSEGYALGTQNGVPVDSSSEYYHNNAKYYKDQSNPGLLTSLQDVNIVNPTVNQVIGYDPINQKFINVNQSGGVSNLVDLSDVNIVNPSNGQTIVYNSTSQKYVNANMPSQDWSSISNKPFNTFNDIFSVNYNDVLNYFPAIPEASANENNGILNLTFSDSNVFTTHISQIIDILQTNKYRLLVSAKTVNPFDIQTIYRLNFSNAMMYFVIDANMSSRIIKAGTILFYELYMESGNLKARYLFDTQLNDDLIQKEPKHTIHYATLEAGQTSITISDELLYYDQNALVKVYTNPFGIFPINMSSSGQDSVVLTFNAQQTDISVAIEITSHYQTPISDYSGYQAPPDSIEAEPILIEEETGVIEEETIGNDTGLVGGGLTSPIILDGGNN